MNLNQRRPASSRPSCDELPVASKGELERRLEECGFRLVSFRKNVNQWNESRDFFARKDGRELWLENTVKGDRPDWNVAWQTFVEHTQ